MTLLSWVLVGLLLLSALAGYRLGHRMRHEARLIVRNQAGQTRALALAIADGGAGGIVNPGDSTLANPTPFQAGETAPGTPAEPVREPLGVPAILEPVYSALKLLPDADWSCPVQPIEIEEFDDPARLGKVIDELPLIATPIYAFLNSEGADPGSLMVIGPSFFGGGIGHSPFVVIEAGLADEKPRPLIDPVELNGKAVGVLGRFMSPTIVLREALKSVGLKSKIWTADEWRNRCPGVDRVDILVNRRFDSQVHEVEAGHTDYALIVYPFTHRHEIAHAHPNGLRHVDLGAISKSMRDSLSARLLNVLVTDKAKYQSSETWRRRVHKLHGEVERLNRQMAQLAQPGGTDALTDASAELDDSFESQEVFESGELDFGAAVRAGVKPAQLLDLARAGNNVEMAPDFDTSEAEAWVEEVGA
jgi:hypothetical protein